MSNKILQYHKQRLISLFINTFVRLFGCVDYVSNLSSFLYTLCNTHRQNKVFQTKYAKCQTQQHIFGPACPKKVSLAVNNGKTRGRKRRTEFGCRPGGVVTRVDGCRGDLSLGNDRNVAARRREDVPDDDRIVGPSALQNLSQLRTHKKVTHMWPHI